MCLENRCIFSVFKVVRVRVQVAFDLELDPTIHPMSLAYNASKVEFFIPFGSKRTKKFAQTKSDYTFSILLTFSL